MSGLGFNSLLWVLICSLLIGCTSSFCRTPTREYPNKKKIKKVELTKDGKKKIPPFVFIYKYDGSLQCEQSRAVAVEEMEKELSGIRVYSREKKRDGLVHAQACGAKTGFANVYKISSQDLEDVEERGFRLWEFE